MRESKKIFLISGARKGIGRFLAEAFLARGAAVCGCSRTKSDLTHENYRHFCLDVSDENAVCAMIGAIKKEFGDIDVLVNNAGTASMNHLLTTPLSAVKDIFATNFFGSFLLARESAKIMMRRKNKPHSIVNFSSIAVGLNLEGESIYAASKAAVESFTKTAARELAPFNIRVNAIAPTPIKTDLIKHIPEPKIRALLARQPLGRFGEIEDVLNALDFLIDEKSAFITGQIIYLGGVNG